MKNDMVYLVIAAIIIRFLIWVTMVGGVLAMVFYCVTAKAEEIPPWKDVGSFCVPVPVEDEQNTTEIKETQKRLLILCHGPYFLQQYKLSLDYHEQLLRTKNDLDLEKKKNLVKGSEWPSVWWFVGAGVAILAGGLTGYLVGVNK